MGCFSERVLPVRDNIFFKKENMPQGHVPGDRQNNSAGGPSLDGEKVCVCVRERAFSLSILSSWPALTSVGRQ